MLRLKQEVHNLKHYLKMKTNDVINCINKTLDAEREAKGLPKMLGHFVFYIDWKKGMGPIKEFQARVDFVNMKYGTTHPVIRYNHVENCPNDLVEKTKEMLELRTLEEFFKALRLGAGKGAYENFVNGEFQGWN